MIVIRISTGGGRIAKPSSEIKLVPSSSPKKKHFFTSSSPFSSVALEAPITLRRGLLGKGKERRGVYSRNNKKTSQKEAGKKGRRDL
jgi:hypothetical protein